MAGAVSRSPARSLRLVAILALLRSARWPSARRRSRAATDRVRPAVDRCGSFGTGLVASQPVTLDGAVGRIEVLVTMADSPAPLVSEVTIPFAGGATTLQHTIGGPDAHILPNTPGPSPLADHLRRHRPGSVPRSRTVVTDERFDWQTLRGDVVRVHWYEGDQAFGERALRIGEREVDETAKLLGVTETEPVDFFIYADQDAVLRRPRAGDARERRRPGERRDPDPLRRYRALRDRRPVGRERRARTS